MDLTNYSVNYWACDQVLIINRKYFTHSLIISWRRRFKGRYLHWCTSIFSFLLVSIFWNQQVILIKPCKMSKMKKFVKNILSWTTVEPMILFYWGAYNMTSTIRQDFFLSIVCHNVYPSSGICQTEYNDTIKHNIESKVRTLCSTS